MTDDRRPGFDPGLTDEADAYLALHRIPPERRAEVAARLVDRHPPQR